MVFLILSIVSSSFIYIIFKLLDVFRIKIFPVIVVNYITATLTGYFFRESNFTINEILSADWIYVSAIIGILFIATFYLIGISSQKAGITLTGISTKMSVVFPILLSIFYYGEKIYFLKTIGIILAVLAIVLSSVKGKDEQQGNAKYIFPLILFLSMGLVDSLVKFNQEEFLKDTGIIESTTVVFAVSALVSVAILIVYTLKTHNFFKKEAVFFGIILGIANFGSLYFLILALNAGFWDSSVVFAVNNSAIILISVLAGRFFFKEKLLWINWSGVALSMLAIIALSQ